MGIKRCPSCGSSKLLARKIVGVQVESLENGEFKINAEGKNYQIEIVGCAKCKSNFDESQLVEMVQCKKCGKFTEPENLDANGECDVCRAIQERPDLANMSREDLIRMMLKLERTVPPVPAPVTPITAVDTTPATSTVAQEKMEAARNAMANAGDTFSKQIVKESQEEVAEVQQNVERMQNDAMNPPVEPTEPDNADAGTKKRRGPRKKSNATAEESTEEQVNDSVDNISDLQEAPFPEQDEALKEAFDAQQEMMEAQAQALVPAPNPTQQFTMFDDEQSF